MAKVADKYFEINPWKIIENGFDTAYGEVAESVFSLGNEYMGIRGYFEEGYSGTKLVGSYFNGIYERTAPDFGHYKGGIDFSEYMVNSVDWLYTKIRIDGETLDLAQSKVEQFVRELDFQTGTLRRSFVWNTKSGKKIALCFERFLSMKQVEIGAQRIEIKAINFDGEITVISGLDFSKPHTMTGKNLWQCKYADINTEHGVSFAIEGKTFYTNQKVYSQAQVDAPYKTIRPVRDEKRVGVEMQIPLKQDVENCITKLVCNITLKEEVQSEIYRAQIQKSPLQKMNYVMLLKENREWWARVWTHSDIVIEGDMENQQGIRFCIFQLFQTYHGAVPGTNIGAKGLTGEAYSGNAFWDTETYCLPFFLFNNREAAKNLLYYRYRTLDEARARAKALDLQGAFYPIATISGKECCSLWQHASLQLQASTAVAYGIWFYEKICHDFDFVKQYGIEMLVEISRMLAVRGDYAPDGTFGYYGVMGPDEFQMMVHHNCYTNYMAKFTMEYTLEKLKQLKAEDLKGYIKIIDRLQISEEERGQWKERAANMYLPYREETGLFEQHDGFFKLPHVDVNQIPVGEFPLYNHWSYDRIFRNDMIKQPDVLMMMLLFNTRFSKEQLQANYEYYAPRCIHESSLSPSVHSILASQLGKHEEAYAFFQFATRMDLDNYNRNTREGIHTTSIAAAWMNIVYGFGGLRTDGKELILNPTIPKDWSRYSFRLNVQDKTIEVSVTKNQVKLYTEDGEGLGLKIYGKEVQLKKGTVAIENQGV